MLISTHFSKRSTAFHSLAPTSGVVCAIAEDYSPEIGLQLAIKVRTISGSNRRFDLRGFAIFQRFVKPFPLCSLQTFAALAKAHVYSLGSTI